LQQFSHQLRHILAFVTQRRGHWVLNDILKGKSWQLRGKKEKKKGKKKREEKEELMFCAP